MKKGILAILILIMTISISVFAEDSTAFIVDSVEDNGIVTVEVNYINNSSVMGGQFNIVYDNSQLEFVEAKKGSIIKNDWVCEINEELGEDRLRVIWVCLDDEMPEAGSILSIKFKLLDNEHNNSYLSFEDFMVVDVVGENIETAYMEVVDVENSKVYSGTELIEDTTDYEAEYEKYIQSILGDDVIFIDGLEDPITDETLPVDKAEEDDKSEEVTTVFSDVKTTDWFFESVNYAKENGLMSGVSSTEFAPEESVTRSMLVVVLHRLEGTPPPAKSSEFADVAADEWYTAGITWAAEQGIVNGVEDTKFAPDAKITREQIAAIMHRYAVYKGYDVSVGESTNILSYDDVDKVSEYAIAPVQWAVGSGLVKGKTASTLNPEDNATRAEIAVILHRFIEANTK